MTAIEPLDAPAIGQARARLQDDRLLRGHGNYIDDHHHGGLAAAVLRSPIASGRITRFDAAAAQAFPGVALVLGPDDVAAHTRRLQSLQFMPGQQLIEVDLVSKTLRYVGQPIAVVVAANRSVAEDAVALIDLDYEELPAVTSLRTARRTDGPFVHPELGTNQSGVPMHVGTPLDELEAAFAAATVVIEREFQVPRIAHSPMEPRGLVADFNARTGEMTVVSSTQVPHLVRQEIGAALQLRVDRVRVVAPDVGGSFGQKTMLFGDELLVCLAAQRLGTAVRWIEDRTEQFVATYQGRGQIARGRLALDDGGRFIAIHAAIDGDLGALSVSGTGGPGPFQVAGLMIEGPYRFAAAGSTIQAFFTNKVPTGAYRGYGMQEATFIRERLVDEAARALDIDPVELRQRNMLQPDELPYVSHTQMPYDNGDYPESLRRAVAMVADGPTAVGTERVRRAVGYASMTEITGYAPTFLMEMFHIHWTGWETGKIRVNEDGTVTVFSGVTSVGQGIETALAQVAADRLGVPVEWIDVQLGDTSTSPYNNMGSQASRGLALAGGALWSAADRLRERMHHIAVDRLGAADPQQVTLDGDSFLDKDSGQRIAWADVAHQGWMGWGRLQHDRIALEETTEYDPASITYGYATHAAQVAVDLDTGIVAVEAYWVVHDSGVVVNPLIADGQTFGGVAMGVGSALLEECRYNPEGTPTSTTYLDYHVPMSADVPDIRIDHMCTPSPLTPGGFKGLGESGTIPPPAAIVNAVAAALPEIAEQLTVIPLTATRLWNHLDRAGLTR